MAKPIKKWFNKGLDVAAWPTNNGGVAFTIRKTFKTKDTGEYKETKNLFPSEIPMLMDLLTQANEWVHREFGEPVSVVDTRPAHPTVQKLVGEITKTFPGSKPVADDDIPF